MSSLGVGEPSCKGPVNILGFLSQMVSISTLPSAWESRYGQYISERAWLCYNKVLFKKLDGGQFREWAMAF